MVMCWTKEQRVYQDAFGYNQEKSQPKLALTIWSCIVFHIWEVYKLQAWFVFGLLFKSSSSSF